MSELQLLRSNATEAERRLSIRSTDVVKEKLRQGLSAEVPHLLVQVVAEGLRISGPGAKPRLLANLARSVDPTLKTLRAILARH